MDKKHEYGQYFTTNIQLQQTVFNFILNNPSTILEPSIGQGHLVSFVRNKLPQVKFDMYEIDPHLTLLDNIQKNKVVYTDFISKKITKKYTTIIGNPPYVRTKKGNLYIDFVEKCFHLLHQNGELIFIVPSDFFKLTSASTLLNTMMQHGSFTHIFHPHNEKMFDDAAIDVIVFRYCKNPSLQNITLYNDTELYVTNTNGLITFGEHDNNNTTNNTFHDYFDIYVGLVTGKEDVYKNEQLGNIYVLNGENKLDKYIYTETFPTSSPDINSHLLQHKTELIERGIRKFNESNWFEWGAPRNISSIRSNMGKECIYVYNLTRKPHVAFIGNVNYFGGGLIMLVPKTETKIKMNLHHILSYINSDAFKSNFIFSGRFKIGHRQIANSILPPHLIPSS
jgi:adenine-specific DNA-methyltransferase